MFRVNKKDTSDDVNDVFLVSLFIVSGVFTYLTLNIFHTLF